MKQHKGKKPNFKERLDAFFSKVGKLYIVGLFKEFIE